MDTNLCMIKENPDEGPSCTLAGRWYRCAAVGNTELEHNTTVQHIDGMKKDKCLDHEGLFLCCQSLLCDMTRMFCVWGPCRGAVLCFHALRAVPCFHGCGNVLCCAVQGPHPAHQPQ